MNDAVAQPNARPSSDKQWNPSDEVANGSADRDHGYEHDDRYHQNWMIGQSARRKGVDCRFAAFKKAECRARRQERELPERQGGEADHAHKKKERAKRAEPRKKNCRETISSLKDRGMSPEKRLPTRSRNNKQMFARWLGRVSS